MDYIQTPDYQNTVEYVAKTFCKKAKVFTDLKKPFDYSVSFIPENEYIYEMGFCDLLQKTTFNLDFCKNLIDTDLEAKVQLSFLEEADGAIFCSLKCYFLTEGNCLNPQINAGFSLKAGMPDAMFEQLISSFIERNPSIATAKSKADLEELLDEDFVSF